MARASRNRTPSGLEEDFVHEVDEDFCCSICQLTMRKPVQTHCGHRYCEECLKEHLRRQDIAGHPRTCPVDRENLPADEEIFFDKATERKILSFIIKCPFTKDGCRWHGELRNKKIHLISCPFEDVPCTNKNCPISVKRKDFDEHLTVTCLWRVVQCVHCHEPHPKGQLKKHVDEKCKKVQLPCPLKCGTLVPREKISNHSIIDCPETIVACPFAEMGCNTKILRKQTDLHLTSCMRLHLDLTCARLQSSQDEQDKLKETTRKLQAQLVDVNKKYNTLQEKVASEQRKSDEKASHHLEEIERDLQGKIDMLQAQLLDVNVKYKTLQEKVASKQRKLEVTYAVLEEKIHTLQNQVKENERKLEERITRREIIDLPPFKKLVEKVIFLEARLRSQVEKENATKPPQFIWKIESFKELFLDRKKKKNLKIESHPFYAAPYSYKLKVYMFPNGQGLGEHSYLSVYLTVVRGYYDAVLAWPFHKKVIITLIDQQENQDRRQNVVKCLFADPKLGNFSKPVAEENSGRGFCRFLAHSELAMERFARDGNMYIQVQICPPS